MKPRQWPEWCKVGWLNTDPTYYADITRATFPFWRSQGATGAACGFLTLEAFRRIFDECQPMGTSDGDYLVLANEGEDDEGA